MDSSFEPEPLLANLPLIQQQFHCYFLPHYGFLAVSQMLNHSDTFSLPSVSVRTGFVSLLILLSLLLCVTLRTGFVGLLILLKPCPTLAFLQKLARVTNGLRFIYMYTCSPRFSIYVVSAPTSMFLLIILGSDNCIMRFAYVFHVRRQIFSPGLFLACTLSM